MSEEIVNDQKNPSTENAASHAALKGLIGTKIGMTQVFVSENKAVPVTVISAEGIVVSQIKTQKVDGYEAIQVSFQDVEERKISKAESFHLSKKGLKQKRFLKEFRVADSAQFKVGQLVPVTVFNKGEKVHVSGLNKGGGFAGSVKRHGFAGGPHSHGHGEYRNSPGSNGAQGPQHVLPGTRKPGHKGNIWQTIQNVEVVDVDLEKSLILLRGSVPGPNGNFVVIRPSNRVTASA